MTLASPRGLDCGDVDLSHRHHRFERTLGRRAIGVGDRFDEDARRDLPRHAPLVFTPAARAFLAAVFDDGAPQAISFGLVVAQPPSAYQRRLYYDTVVGSE